MYGAILGDIIGSPYEFDRGNKTKNFPMFSKNSTYTDDTVMTTAIADAFLAISSEMEDDTIKHRIIQKMQKYSSYEEAAFFKSCFKAYTSH